MTGEEHLIDDKCFSFYSYLEGLIKSNNNILKNCGIKTYGAQKVTICINEFYQIRPIVGLA